MNRPSARNAISPAMRRGADEMHSARRPRTRRAGWWSCDGAGADFCAGADLSELAAAVEGEGGVATCESFDALLEAVENQPQPVDRRLWTARRSEQAACWCSHCDLAIAADDARLGIPSGPPRTWS